MKNAHRLWPTFSTEGLEYTVWVPCCQFTHTLFMLPEHAQF